MPRKPRNPGSGKAPYHGPSKGPGIGGPRAGAGWGGPASGGNSLKNTDDPATQRRRSMLRFDGEHQARKEEVAAEMRGVLYDIATEAPETMARLNAADKLLDRIEGKAVQKSDITTKGDRLGYVIAAPQEAADAEEWANQHKPH
jgi:hypothetical protein